MNGATTILAVDDDPTNLLLLDSILRKEGFHVLKANRGTTARAIAHEHQPDLILLDWQMPDEDGLETCQKLKASAATAQIPVIFVSSEENVGVKVNAFDAGAVDYITKPYARNECVGSA